MHKLQYIRAKERLFVQLLLDKVTMCSTVKLSEQGTTVKLHSKYLLMYKIV